MKIVVSALGIRGDVQPYIALSQGLIEAGHHVGILAHRIFHSLVDSYGLDSYLLALNPRQVFINQSLTELGNRPCRIMRWILANFRPQMMELFRETYTAAKGSDILIKSGPSLAGWHIAEKLDLHQASAPDL